MANDSMWPARSRWLENRNKSSLLPIKAVWSKRPKWWVCLTFLHRTQRSCWWPRGRWGPPTAAPLAPQCSVFSQGQDIPWEREEGKMGGKDKEGGKRRKEEERGGKRRKGRRKEEGGRRKGRRRKKGGKTPKTWHVLWRLQPQCTRGLEGGSVCMLGDWREGLCVCVLGDWQLQSQWLHC